MRFFLTVVLLLAATLLFAQPKIEFKSAIHDYGNIKEDGGMAETVFEFTNTGNQPLILNNVRATCGCTTPEWTKDPVLPGKSGSIKVGYNPQNRPGAFSKNVNVYANTQPGVTVLTIKGNVAQREKTLEELYPREMGPLRWKSNFVSMGSMVNTATKTEELEFINNTQNPVRMGVNRAPDHITVKYQPEVVEPGKVGKMIVSYDARKNSAYGSVSDRIYLTIDNEKQNTYNVGVSVTINEDFSKLSTQELANAPVAVFDNTIFDFGKLKQGEVARNSFKLTNKGKTDLQIRNVRAACGCTAVKHENIVKPGQTIELAVEFNSRNQRNRQNKSVTVITNDPKNPTTVLRIMGTVEQ